MFEIRHDFRLESSRSLPHLPKTHPCSQIHGHSFKVTLVLRGDLDPKLGWVMDYHEIKKQSEPVLKQLDHRLLNEVSGLENPTTEILTRWIYQKLKPSLNGLHQVIISETFDTECRYPA